MRPTVFILVAILAASAVAAPQQQQQRQQQSEEEQEDITTTTTVASVRRPPAEQRKPIEADTSSEEELKPVAIHRPATHDTASAKPEVNSDSDPATDVRREEHKKIVPFQFHRVCRELDLKRQNCSCVWESTFQDGLDVASEKTRECKKDTEEEVHECLKEFAGYEQCLANPAFEHHRPAGIPDDLLNKKCQEFSLSDTLCTCLKDRDNNTELKSALVACKDEARKSQTDSNTKSKRQAAKTDEAEEISEHSQATPPPVPQHQVNKECVVAALNAHCNTSISSSSNNNNNNTKSN